MSKSIHIFKSFEEQEEYNRQSIIVSTPAERFKKLYRMQQLSKKFNPKNT